MQVVVWLGICVVLAGMWIDRPEKLLLAGLVLRILVPSSASSFFTGAWTLTPLVHPSTPIIILAFLLTLTNRGRQVKQETGASPGLYWSLISIVILYSTVTVVNRGNLPSLIGMVNVLVAPMLVFFMARVFARASEGYLRGLAQWFVGLACFEAVLALVQMFSFSRVVWSSYSIDPFVRPMGTLDSPLDLAFFLALAVPVASVVPKSGRRLAIIFLIVVGIIASASRLPAAAAVIGVMWHVVIRAGTIRQRFLGIAAASIGAFLVVQGGISVALTQRVDNDNGSGAARTAAYAYLREHLFDHWVFGEGWGSTAGLKGTVLGSSLESGYGIYAIGLGVLGTVALIVTQACVIVSRTSRGVDGAALAATLGIVLATFYSGLSTMSAASFVLWLMFAFHGVPGEVHDDPVEPDDTAAKQRKAAQRRRAQARLRRSYN